MKKSFKLVELFSGIGSQYRALKNLGVKVDTVGTCEWDIHALVAYDLIHGFSQMPLDITKKNKEDLLKELKQFIFSNSGKSELSFSSLSSYSVDALRRIYSSVINNNNYVNINQLDGKDMPGDIDILTYSFPCQDLSNVGAFHGYNKGIDQNSGSRSSLLWQVGRVLNEMKEGGKDLPKYLIMENVPTLLSERHMPNFSKWINDLSEIGYLSKCFQLNASSFGLPQNRPRLIMISVQVGDNKVRENVVQMYFDNTSEDDVIKEYKKHDRYKELSVSDLLRIDYSNDKIKREAIECTPNDTVSRRKIWDENPKIIDENNKLNCSIKTIRTITTKQDRHPNSGNLYFDTGIVGRSKFRYLTPRECMLFMGFEDKDYDALIDNNVEFHKGDALFSRDKIIRMSGNSIPVKLLEGVFLQIILIDKLLEELSDTYSDDIKNYTRDDAIRDIKSFMFRHGIRSQHKNTDDDSAEILYPRYRTVIYVMDEFNCEDCFNGLSKQSVDLLKRITNDERVALKEKIRMHKEFGWQVIQLPKDAIYKGGSSLLYSALHQIKQYQ